MFNNFSIVKCNDSSSSLVYLNFADYRKKYKKSNLVDKHRKDKKKLKNMKIVMSYYLLLLLI